MHRNRLFPESPAYVAAFAVCLLLFALCTTSDNPYTQPENISVLLSVEGDSGIVDHDIRDTLRLDVILRNADLVERVVVNWNAQAETPDTFTITTDRFSDTIPVRHLFTSEGARVVRATAIAADADIARSSEITIRIGKGPVRITVTSPLMQSDSAVVDQTLLAIGGTASSSAGIAGVTVFVDTVQAPVVGTQSWSFALSRLATGNWNRVRIMALDQSGAADTLTVFLFLMPDLGTLSAPAVTQRLCKRIDLAWHKIPLCSLYLVYRFSPDSQTLDTVIQVADTAIIDSGLPPGLAYWYAYRGWYRVPGMQASSDTTDRSALMRVKTVQCFEKTFGGLNGDSAVGVMVTPDSGYLVVGTSWSTRPGYSDIYLVRLDESGDTVWSLPYGPSQEYMAATMRPGADGEAIVGGSYSCASCGMSNVASISAFSVLDGTVLSSATLERMDRNFAYDALRTSAGGFAYAGWDRAPATIPITSGMDTMAFAYMLNAAGDSVWKKYLAFEGMGSKARSITQSGDGSLFITGVSWLGVPPVGGSTPQPHCFVAKLSTGGDSLWSRTYGTAATYTNGLLIRPTSDGGFIISGETALTGLPRDMYLLKITGAGAQQWAFSYGSAADDFGVQVVECFDHGFAVAGGSLGTQGGDCNAYLVKTDAQGVKQWEASFGGAQFDCAWSLAQTPDSGFVLAGQTRSFGIGNTDMYVVKTDKRGSKIK